MKSVLILPCICEPTFPKHPGLYQDPSDHSSTIKIRTAIQTEGVHRKARAQDQWDFIPYFKAVSSRGNYRLK